ncbi:BRD4-interacting chromatin-remodeling complex-associated protein-like [Empidonax traillii]|uniref:BRD4-interacting chromatin-remodeling complex-associated protein-like n=1 Tax=Empidonax traillii TaxID=164674 RepID=UPI000FFD895E|nr:BRD4-interacting chromatin-remodeling complex-associated protein-like [Empidonax traillii]
MARCRPWSILFSLIPPDLTDIGDEDSWGLSDVFCDPQVVNDFLPGFTKTDRAAVLDSTEDAASSVLEGTGLWESSSSLLSAELSQPMASTGLAVPQDASLGWQWDSRAATVGPPCDLLQQCLWEAGITEQLLEAEAKQDPGSFQPPPQLQPLGQVAFSSTLQVCSTGTDVPASCPHSAPCQQPLLNKEGNVQPFPQHLGPFSSLQGPGGTLGVGPSQVWGQQVMAQPVQQVVFLQQTYG